MAKTNIKKRKTYGLKYFQVVYDGKCRSYTRFGNAVRFMRTLHNSHEIDSIESRSRGSITFYMESRAPWDWLKCAEHTPGYQVFHNRLGMLMRTRPGLMSEYGWLE